MASPLHLINSNILNRFVIPAVTIAYRSLSTNSATNFSKQYLLREGIFVSSPRTKVDLRSPEPFSRFDIRSHSHKRFAFDPTRIPSTTKVGREFESNIGPDRTPEKTESDKAVYVFFNMPGVKKEDMKVYVEHIRSTPILTVNGYAPKSNTTYSHRSMFPQNVDINNSDIKGELTEMKDGMFKLTLPKAKHLNDTTMIHIFVNYIIANIRYLYMFLLSVDAISAYARMIFARSHIKKKLSSEPFSSFSMYTEVAAKRVYTCDLSGLAETEFRRAGVCVSLYMPSEYIKIEDMKSYFKRDTLFIKGKTKTEAKKKVHFITGIRLPKSILKDQKRVTTELKDGIYKASLPYRTFEINIKSNP